MYHAHYHLRVIPIENGKVEIPFPMHTSVILDVVDGADVATEEGCEDVISLYSTGRRSCDAVTE